MSFYSYLKPQWMTDFNPLKSLELFVTSMDENDLLFQKGFETWKKYESLFCGKNLFFDSFEQKQELHYMKVVVINKSLLLSKLNEHLFHFSEYDFSFADAESVFNALLNNQKFREKFYSRHDLMGICLGYGERNAALFQKMSDLRTATGKQGFSIIIPSSARFRELEQELVQLENSFTGRIRDHVSRKFLFNVGVGFRADASDPETLELQENYTTFHKKITQTYKSGNFLEKTLELIILADNQVNKTPFISSILTSLFPLFDEEGNLDSYKCYAKQGL